MCCVCLGFGLWGFVDLLDTSRGFYFVLGSSWLGSLLWGLFYCFVLVLRVVGV